MNLPFDISGSGHTGFRSGTPGATGSVANGPAADGTPDRSAIGLFAALLSGVEPTTDAGSTPDPARAGTSPDMSARRTSDNWLDVQLGDMDLEKLGAALDRITTGTRNGGEPGGLPDKLVAALKAETGATGSTPLIADLMGQLSDLIEGYAQRLETERPPSPELMAEAQMAVELPAALADWLGRLTAAPENQQAANAAAASNAQSGSASTQAPATPRQALGQLIAILEQVGQDTPARTGDGEAKAPLQTGAPAQAPTPAADPGQVLTRLADLAGLGQKQADGRNTAAAGDDGTQPQTANGTQQPQSSELAAKLRTLAGDLDVMRQAMDPGSAQRQIGNAGKSTTPSIGSVLGQAASAPVAGTASEIPAGPAQTDLTASIRARFEGAANAQAQENGRPAGGDQPQTLGQHLKAQQAPNAPQPRPATLAQPQPVQAGQVMPTDAGADPVVTHQVTAQGAPPVSADATSAARPMQAAYQPPQINMPQVAFEMTRHLQAGQNRFQIRLDPPELGRIDVRMDVDQNGAVKAHLTADRPETLDMLQRDARALERALQQAGLDSSKTNLEFSLRQQGFGQNQAGKNGDGMAGDGRSGGQPANGGPEATDTNETTDSQSPGAFRGVATPGGLNLWV